MLLNLTDQNRTQPVAGSKIDGFEPVERLRRSGCDFPCCGRIELGSSTCQNQLQLGLCVMLWFERAHGNRAITTRKSPRRWRQDFTPPRLPSVVHPVLSIVPMPPSSLPLLPTVKVKSASFPSLARLGDRYSKRFGS